jgi:DNA modification methylase
MDFVLCGALENPEGEGRIIQHDARELASLEIEPFDLVITSPPYANRMSYIRELRPYMYWLRFLLTARDAGELDWQAIGGTWGIATSRLNEWAPPLGSYQSDELDTNLERIANPENANGALMATYVHKYFVDMAEHFASLRKTLKPGARIHYVVGNSTFYGVLLPVEIYYADIMKRLGFTEINIRAVRKRNSKKELVEFDVSARWEG